MRKVFMFRRKNISLFYCALLSRGVLCLALHVSNDGCRVQGEKRLPPFWHASFYFFEGVFDSYLSGVGVSSFRAVDFCFGHFERPNVFGVCLALVVSLFLPKVWFRPFKRSKPLGFCLALIVPLFSPKVFWFGPFERSKPLGFCLALIVPLVPNVFLVRTF